MIWRVARRVQRTRHNGTNWQQNHVVIHSTALSSYKSQLQITSIIVIFTGERVCQKLPHPQLSLYRRARSSASIQIESHGSYSTFLLRDRIDSFYSQRKSDSETESPCQRIEIVEFSYNSFPAFPNCSGFVPPSHGPSIVRLYNPTNCFFDFHRLFQVRWEGEKNDKCEVGSGRQTKCIQLPQC
jgi:hypothetical protein